MSFYKQEEDWLVGINKLTITESRGRKSGVRTKSLLTQAYNLRKQKSFITCLVILPEVNKGHQRCDSQNFILTASKIKKSVQCRRLVYSWTTNFVHNHRPFIKLCIQLYPIHLFRMFPVELLILLSFSLGLTAKKK